MMLLEIGSFIFSRPYTATVETQESWPGYFVSNGRVSKDRGNSIVAATIEVKFLSGNGSATSHFALPTHGGPKYCSQSAVKARKLPVSGEAEFDRTPPCAPKAPNRSSDQGGLLTATWNSCRARVTTARRALRGKSEGWQIPCEFGRVSHGEPFGLQCI
jgi:hypothetical protein